MHPRIVFHLGNEAPIGLPFVHLCARAAVNADRFDSDVLKALCNFHNEFGLVIPTQPGFDRYRKRSTVDNLFGHGNHFGNVLQNPSAGPFARDLLHGATVIDVDDIWTCLLCDRRCLAHGFDLTAEYLYSDGAFIFKNIELRSALGCIAN